MEWVIDKLRRLLRSEKMFGTKHTPLMGDAKYKISAEFAKDRIPQLEQAIKILEESKNPRANIAPVVRKKRACNDQQLNLFK